MNLSFRPMLACSTIPELDEIKYPVLASPKLDGIRCIMGDGIAFSRTMKRIPNKFIQDTLKKLNLHGLDGELMIDGDFNNVQSAIMSGRHIEESKFYYNVFDDFTNPTIPFKFRFEAANEKVKKLNDSRIRIVPHQKIYNKAEMEMYLRLCIESKYEGVIIRDPNAIYKNGRSTMKQGWMLKLKIFQDAEACITGFTELMHNDDTSTHKKENMISGETLGALIVQWRGKIFNIGSGFSNEQRDEIWRNKDKYINKHVTFKYQELSKYGVPRFPIYKTIRHEEDMSHG